MRTYLRRRGAVRAELERARERGVRQARRRVAYRRRYHA